MHSSVRLETVKDKKMTQKKIELQMASNFMVWDETVRTGFDNYQKGLSMCFYSKIDLSFLSFVLKNPHLRPRLMGQRP